ncbi:hypothetical protein [Streptomyces guryensis]|uniref:Lipoprotein n=1 Tax=Streptomyces guryensis TaxID=2886947 RepID=A0A9Q3VT16_9ACTN|nr:hypothetical protein [Streptomyces guryensis]MCD9877936.1 hypothetical protein [Streptomyces guryensis]
MTRRLPAAAVATVLMAGLGACGGAGTEAAGHGSVVKETRASAERVSGLRDTLRHLPRKTVTGTRAHLVTKCTSTTRQVRHTTRPGTGTRKTTRVWYTTEHHQSCRKVRQGTESYRRVVRPERWCVSLDDVTGGKSRDDVWYRVTRETYHQVLAADAHARVAFTPTGTGC